MNAWETYTLNEAMPWWVLQDLPRREARAEFELTMQRKSGRIEMLKRVLAESGLAFDGRDDSIQCLESPVRASPSLPQSTQQPPRGRPPTCRRSPAEDRSHRLAA